MFSRICCLIGLLCLLVRGAALAENVRPLQRTGLDSLCPMIQAAAKANALPVGFFERLIWQESRFRADAVGPQTRSGAHALGIAQFMPETAFENGLFEPFDPQQALPRSGAFLAELRDEFGNLGLAAAAYNAGPQRVRDFLSGSRSLPEETRAYVLAVTGHPVEDWTKISPNLTDAQNAGEPLVDTLPTNCRELVASLERWSPQEIARNVPSWCRGLNHPNAAVCGPVHASEPARYTAFSRSRNQLRLVRSLR
jgi:Transglycosylase SLT domain